MEGFPAKKIWNIPVFLLTVILLPSCHGEGDGTTPPRAGSPGAGVERLMKNLDSLQTGGMYEGVLLAGDSTGELKAVHAMMNKSVEELREEVLSVVKEEDRQDIAKELGTIFDVGADKGFFLRQLSYCKIHIDLAILGMGIIRVHGVLKGENSTVRPGREKVFINFVKKQVEQGIAANDLNYKAIVFQGLEASTN